MPPLESLLHKRDELFVVEELVDWLQQVVLDEGGLLVEHNVEERGLPVEPTDHAYSILSIMHASKENRPKFHDPPCQRGPRLSVARTKARRFATAYS